MRALGLIAALCLGSAALADERHGDVSALDFMTEDYPPYTFSDGGTVAGAAVDLLMQIFKELRVNKTKSDIDVLPWARAYHAAQSPGERNVLFTMSRTKARENLFKWVGPIFDSKVSVFAKANSDVAIGSEFRLKDFKYVVVRGDIGGIKLTEFGVPQTQIRSLNRFQQLVDSVLKDRVCCFSYGEDTTLWQLRQLGYDRASLKVVYTFMPMGKMYLAFNLSVDDETVDRYQAVVERLTSNARLMEDLWLPYR